MYTQVKEVLAAMGTAVAGKWQHLDRLVDAQVSDALKGERDDSANVLANDGVVDAA